MEEIIRYLKSNPEELQSILEGKASLLHVNAKELLEIIRFFSEETPKVMNVWWS